MQPRQTTSLHHLILKQQGSNAITALQKDAKSISATLNEAGEYGLTLLQLAAREGLSDVVLTLCLHGADPEIALPGEAKSNPTGKSAFDIAKDYQHEIIIKILKIFSPKSVDKDETILKAAYLHAVKSYPSPAGLTLPECSMAICHGLMELAACLNKSDWVEHFLSLYPCYETPNSLARTPAYWAACRDNEELFHKLSKTKKTKELTAFQLQDDHHSAAREKYCKGVEIREDTDETEAPVDKKYRKPYNSALKYNKDIVITFSYDTRRAILQQAIDCNHFVAAAVIHECFHKTKQHFVSQLLTTPALMEFELVSQNISYYPFVTQLNLFLHKDYIQKVCNKTGLLNFILGSLLAHEKVTGQELEIYNVLSKNDVEVLRLTKARLQDFYADTNSLEAQQKLHQILDHLALRHLNRSGDDKATIKDLSDASLKMIFSYLLHPEAVSKLPALEDNKENKESKANTLELKENKAAKSLISSVSKRFYLVSSGKAADPKQAVADTQLMLGDIQRLKTLTAHQIEVLTEFKKGLAVELRKNKKFYINCSNGWSFAGIVGISALFFGNIICLTYLIPNQQNIIDHLSTIPLQDGSTCAQYNLRGINGCSYLDDRGYPVHGNIPVVCQAVCDLLSIADANKAGSIVTMAILSLVFLLSVPPLTYCLGTNDIESWEESSHLRTSLSEYSVSLQKRLPDISPLLKNPIDGKTKHVDALQKVTERLTEKKAELDNLKDREKFTTNRKKLFGFFSEPERKEEVVLDIQLHPNESKIDDNAHPVISVPTIGSLNNNPEEPLLAQAPPARKSICSNCRVM